MLLFTFFKSNIYMFIIYPGATSLPFKFPDFSSPRSVRWYSLLLHALVLFQTGSYYPLGVGGRGVQGGDLQHHDVDSGVHGNVILS